MVDYESCKLDKAIVETFEKGGGQIGIESEITRIQFGQLPFRISTSLLKFRDEELVVLAMEDISEEKMQDRIRIENSRLIAAAGTVAKVCYDMGQPLMAMTGFVGLLHMKGEEDESTRKLVEDVKTQASLLAEMTMRLMNARAG